MGVCISPSEVRLIVLANALIALAYLVHGVLSLATAALFIRIILSWINPRPRHRIVRTLISGLYQLTDPVLHRVRRTLPFLVLGGLDLSPIALFLGLGFADRFLTGTLTSIGTAMI